MKFFKYLIVGIFAVSGLTLTNCSEDYLDTLPTDRVSDELISETLDGLYLALNGIHRNMVSQFIGIQGMGGEPGFMISREAHGDDMTWDTQTWHQTHLTWAINVNPTSSYNAGIWRTYYQFILNANLILEKLDGKFAGSTDPLAKYIKGEALSIRAWAHFNLVQYYAKRYAAGTQNSQLGVPYRETSETTEMARNTVEEVYTKINADLDEAIRLLDGYKATDVTHYSQKVTYGLKARVALTQQNYSVAADAAAKAIENAEKEGFAIMTTSQLMNGFSDIVTTTKEALYAARTLDDHTVYFYSFYAYMGWNYNSSSNRTGIKCISQTTYDLMSPTDLRRQWWDPTGEASVPNSTYNQRVYQLRKFIARSTANAVGDVAFMRISELYLMASEAYARAGQTEEAKKYFYKFVLQRDPSYVDSGKTGADLAEEIMNHRRIELWGEGFRWFDLKRLNLPCKRTGSNFNKAFCGFLERTVEENGWYYEIPEAETNYNKLMVKNY
ncbi:hypothetical protein FACS189426_17750 [Bacteroidia bacterium]|nr:hypothetical protein FACS189426_17750 [Bacteroidia bacterium]